jgi:hypothetical protein
MPEITEEEITEILQEVCGDKCDEEDCKGERELIKKCFSRWQKKQ